MGLSHRTDIGCNRTAGGPACVCVFGGAKLGWMRLLLLLLLLPSLAGAQDFADVQRIRRLAERPALSFATASRVSLQPGPTTTATRADRRTVGKIILGAVTGGILGGMFLF